MGGRFALHTRVLNDQGLHARPAARLAQEAQEFGCAIEMALDGTVVDAKSILDILTLAAGQGSELELRAKGPDAHRGPAQPWVRFSATVSADGATRDGSRRPAPRFGENPRFQPVVRRAGMR